MIQGTKHRFSDTSIGVEVYYNDVLQSGVSGSIDAQPGDVLRAEVNGWGNSGLVAGISAGFFHASAHNIGAGIGGIVNMLTAAVNANGVDAFAIIEMASTLEILGLSQQRVDGITSDTISGNSRIENNMFINLDMFGGLEQLTNEEEHLFEDASTMYSVGLTHNFGALSSTATVDATLVLTVLPATVPIPTAVWLFSSGLIGLIGVARIKKA